MRENKLFCDWMPYTAIIEGPDGHTYEQSYTDYFQLIELVEDIFGEDYRIVSIY